MVKQVWTHSSHPQGIAGELGGKMSFVPCKILTAPRNNSSVVPAKRARAKQSWEQAYALPGTDLWREACASLQDTLLSGVCHSSCYSDLLLLLYSLFQTPLYAPWYPLSGPFHLLVTCFCFPAYAPLVVGCEGHWGAGDTGGAKWGLKMSPSRGVAHV